jgi:hypothetical protein
MTMSAKDILDREFLEIRAKILELAASFDRLDRADGSVARDPRMEKIARGIAVLQGADPCRAEHLQMIFSRDYDPDWRRSFRLDENTTK